LKESFLVKHREENKSVWRRKSDQQEKEENKLSLHAQRKINQWCVDSGCSKHMIGEQRKFLVIKRGKRGNVTFGNDDSTKIIGK
jgi:hypothetical protein